MAKKHSWLLESHACITFFSREKWTLLLKNSYTKYLYIYKPTVFFGETPTLLAFIHGQISP